MGIPRQVQEELDKKRRWLEKNETDYLNATKVLRSAKRLKEMLDGLRARMDILLAYDPDNQPSHSAVYVVASVKERMTGLFEDLDFIDEYEDKKEDYVETVKAYALEEERDEKETTD